MTRFFATGILLASCIAAPSAAQEAVVIFSRREMPPQRVPFAKLAEMRSGDVTAVWVWSATTPPRRTTLRGAAAALRERSATTVDVRVDRQDLEEKSRLTVIGAPAAMWEEVAEDLLPSWPVAAGDRVQLPADRAEWRLRITGTTHGTWWTDVPSGRTAVVLSPLRAADRVLELVDERREALDRGRLSIIDEGAARGDFRKLSDHRADRRGRVVIPALPDAAAVTLVVSVTGYAPAVTSARPASFPRVLVLSRGASVSGRVVSADGDPLPGVRVRLRTWVSDALPLPLTRQTETGEDGRWRVDALPPGRGEWRATADGFAAIHREVRLDGAAVDAGTAVLRRAADVRLQIRDDAGEPVSGTRVTIEGAEESVTADEEGRVRLSAAPGETIRVKAVAPRHRAATLTIASPFPELTDVVLERAFRVTGRLVDAAGLPLEHATVRVSRGGSFDTKAIGDGGAFELDLHPGVAHELQFRSPRTAVTAIHVPAGRPGGHLELGDIAAAAGLQITGRLVRRTDHAPVAGARVWVPRPSEAGELMAWALRDVLETMSDADGRFALPGVPPSPFVLRIEAAGLAPLRRALRPEADTQTLDVGDVELQSGATLTVRLAGDGGAGAQARVDAGGRGLPMDVLTAPFVDREATIASSPAGKVFVSAWRGRDMLCRQEVVVPAGQVDVSVTCTVARVAVSGEIRVGGHPVGPGRVVLLPPVDADLGSGIFTFGSGASRQQQVFAPDMRQESASVGFDGRFERLHVLAGPWDVVWMPEEGQAVGPKRIVIPEAASHHLVLTYPGLSLRGVVVDAAGDPVARAQVRELGGAAFAMTARDGTFTLAGPGAGSWQVQAQHGMRTSVPLNVVVADGGAPEPLRLVLDAEPHLLRVDVAAERQPVSSPIVFVEMEPGGLRVSSGDAAGRAELRLSPPFPLRVRAAAAVNGSWTTGPWVEWDTARNEGLTLLLGASGSLVIDGAASGGDVQLTSGDGWRFDRLLRWLGTFVRVAPDAPATIHGLPPGSYIVEIGARREAVVVQSDTATRVSLD